MYTLATLLEDCAESPKHSKASHEIFKMVWGGLMAWVSSNWMVGKGARASHGVSLQLGLAYRASAPSRRPPGSHGKVRLLHGGAGSRHAEETHVQGRARSRRRTTPLNLPAVQVPSFIANEEYLRTYGIKYKAFAQKKVRCDATHTLTTLSRHLPRQAPRHSLHRSDHSRVRTGGRCCDGDELLQHRPVRHHQQRHGAALPEGATDHAFPRSSEPPCYFST